MSSDLLHRDLAVCWHPYTQHQTEPDPLPIVAARGAELELADGRVLLDAIASWWANLHGHGRPELVAAMASQAERLDHVLFAGATHEPAVGLAEALVDVTPRGLTRVFYSDDGSTAVEVALKMAYQQWVHRGEPQRTTFIALEGGYHGDTFGAMAVGDPDPFFRAFAPLMFKAVRVPAEAYAIAREVERLGERAAGFIFEPRVQGAAGMVMHPPRLVAAAREICDAAGIPLIADEVMTGFGRTGSLFACDTAGVAPDLLCLAKGLTGGIFPLAATLATEAIYEAFLAADRSRAFFHGHTFTAHAVGCAVGLASLELCRAEDTPARLDAIGRAIEEILTRELAGAAGVHEIRRTGGIVAVELAAPDAGYLAGLGPWLRAAALERGVLLRPLGNVLYAMPPSCTSREQVESIATAMVELAREAPRRERL